MYSGMRSLLFSFFLLAAYPSTLLANQEIVVHLPSQEHTIPLYFAALQEKGSGFEKSYIDSLEKVIRFDFSHNGKTELISSPHKSEKLEVTIHQKKLKVQATTAGASKGVEGIALTGDLSQDRKILHKIHDVILENLFSTGGVADTHILYTVRTRSSEHSTEWMSEVWRSDYDGAHAQQVTNDQCLCVTSAYIPSSTKGACRNFLYVSYKAGQPKIYVAALDEGAGKSITQRLSYLRGNQLMPAISPTLDKIAFISDISGNPDLFVQEFSPTTGLSGKPRQVFCSLGATQGSPTFSPDGKKLAFVSNKDGTPRIYILEIPTSGASINQIKPKMVSKKTRENTSPSWSPDGKKIAYSALAGGYRQIWIYDLATEEESQLTDGKEHKENPTWAPNSLHLAFHASTPTTSDLYLINLNQKNAVKITRGPGEKRFPSWESLKYERKL